MIVLVIGGSGSGKSEYAERLALQLAGDMPRIYLATMQVWDGECRARIARHRRQRAGRGFATVECPRNLAGLTPSELDSGGTILLEDLGNLAANELYAPGATPAGAYKSILAGVEHLAAAGRHLVIVSNEVGTGGEMYAGETQAYLQLLGRLHQALAQRADAVCEVVAGLPQYYKGREPE